MGYPKPFLDLENKLDKSEVTTTPTPNKILKCDNNGDLPVDITGDAKTVGEKGLSTSTKKFDAIPTVNANGEINIGKTINFYNSSSDTNKTNQIVSDSAGNILINNFSILHSGMGGLKSGIDADKLNGQTAYQLAPVGMVGFFAMNTPPSGWLKCNGATLNRKTYADLFYAIGTTFGKGDGSTTFKLPDLRGEFIRGWDDGRNVDKNRVFGSLQKDDFKSHNHREMVANKFNVSATNGTSYVYGLTGGASNPSPSYGASFQMTDKTGGIETRPRNVALLPCIKYLGIVPNSGLTTFNIRMTAGIENTGVVSTSGVNTCSIGSENSGLKMDLFSMSIDGIDFSYTCHISDIGDSSSSDEGYAIGFTNKRIEGIKIDVTRIPSNYQFYYRTYVQSKGWQPWVLSGTFSGTKGLSLRVESIQVKVVQI